jgi:hypothetical protein
MNNYKNPFEYEQATTLTPDFVKSVFIEDHSYTRFIQSTRNVFLVGERGSGKSMTLIYNSLNVRTVQPVDTLDLSYIGVYVPCNTTLTHKREYELFPDVSFRQIVSEHFMVLGIAHSIAQALSSLPDGNSISEDKAFATKLAYVLGVEFPSADSSLSSLMLFLEKEASRSQKALNALRHEEFRSSAYTFASLIQPLIWSLRRIKKLEKSHFMLLIDDAHDLNPYQKETLNSWLAYRDRSGFSFKVAVADARGYSFRTLSGGSLLEGHDFLMIDLQKPFQNANSDFGKMAKGIIEKRLATIGLSMTAEQFFPGSPEFEAELTKCKAATMEEAILAFPAPADVKARADYVYKYSRARYFRERSARANLPLYAGLDTITHVSTGVIRNLLMPCYWMYDALISEANHPERDLPSSIPPHIQSKVILARSTELWEWLEHSLVSSIDNCTLEDSKRLFQLFSNLGDLFHFRLMNAASEPRAIAFTISAMSKKYEDTLLPLLEIGRRAQLLYFRNGPSKDGGRRETFYVPNRMLWPIRGLDVVGQHARVSLKAADLWAAAEGSPFPQGASEEAVQGGLFDEQD